MTRPDSAVSLRGQVGRVDGQLALCIPLAAGGDKLALHAKTIGTVDEEYLTVIIPPWLAEKLRIDEGSWVFVDNLEGRFRITRSAENDEAPGTA